VFSSGRGFYDFVLIYLLSLFLVLVPVLVRVVGIRLGFGLGEIRTQTAPAVQLDSSPLP
jgi:hypothetical protein